MFTFTYTARDANGAASSGTRNAASLEEASQSLRREGLYPVEVRPIEEVARQASSTADSDDPGIRIPRAEVIQLTTQLAVMVETGVTLREALDCMSGQSDNPPVKRLIEDLSAHVQAGSDFSSALSRHPRSFPKLFVELIRASEKSGMMAALLRRGNDYLRDEEQIRRRVKGALIYPLIMFSFALGTTLFLLTFVMPRFTGIYAAKAAALPVPTRVLMGLSDFVVGNWVLLLIATALTVAGGWFYLGTEDGRRMWHLAQLRMPLVGPVIRKLHLARGLRMIGTMSGAGINLVDCVATARQLCGNHHYQELWDEVSEQIQVGKQLSEPLFQSPLVPRAVAQMIHTGEKSGRLAPVMEQIATYSEEELKEKIADLTRYIEPAMILVMGLIIGGVAMALLLPIFTIGRVMGQ
jgi:type IV pilus assembly protein PilC